jgi:pimeloyl-ACP methyl ester carboxylesterase
MGAVEHDGRTVAFHDTGAPNDGRVPIVLVHGTGGTAEAHFRTVYPMLAARHRVIALDLVVSDDDELDHLIAQVVAVIESRSPGTPVHLVGYSLGSVVVAALAGRRADLVETLTLLAGWVATDKQQRLRYDVWEALRASGGRALQEFQTLTSRAFRDGIDAEMRINRTVDISADIARITAPTLVVGCAGDQMVPITHAYMLLGGIENARFVEIDSGHAVTVERPAQVFMLIDNFVKNPDEHAAGETIPQLTI